MKTSDSLGGQNSPGRGSGARSSRAHSTLFKTLRKLDHNITSLDKSISIAWGVNLRRLQSQRAELDAKRKEVRAKRKAAQNDARGGIGRLTQKS
jgi:hypothetical protein